MRLGALAETKQLGNDGTSLNAEACVLSLCHGPGGGQAISENQKIFVSLAPKLIWHPIPFPVRPHPHLAVGPQASNFISLSLSCSVKCFVKWETGHSFLAGCQKAQMTACGARQAAITEPCGRFSRRLLLLKGISLPVLLLCSKPFDGSLLEKSKSLGMT